MKSYVQAFMLAATLAASFSLVTPTSTHAQDAKVPVTAEDHLALSKSYAEKAAAYRAEAEYHRKMAEAYKKSVATSPKAPPNPWVVKMEKHCQAIARDAEKLASDAQKAADYHTLRAKELQGK